MNKSTIRIFATDEQGTREEIDDLYWFEEQGVHDFCGEGCPGKYRLEVFVNGKLVYPGLKGRVETSA